MYNNKHCEKVGDYMGLIKTRFIKSMNLEKLELLSEQGSELSVKDSINKFVKEHIKVDEAEKRLIMSLYIK